MTEQWFLGERMVEQLKSFSEARKGNERFLQLGSTYGRAKSFHKQHRNKPKCLSQTPPFSKFRNRREFSIRSFEKPRRKLIRASYN